MSPATRTMKNSSRLEPRMERNFTRSSRGFVVILRLLQNPVLKGEQAQFTVDVERRIVKRRVSDGACSWVFGDWPLRGVLTFSWFPLSAYRVAFDLPAPIL